MNAITRQRRNFHCMRIAGVMILIIAVWGTLGLQAQNLPETAAITAPTAVAVPTMPIAAPPVEPPPTTVAASASIVATPAPASPARGTAARADGAPIEAVNTVEVMVGQSTVLDVGTPITRVSLTSPDVADALVTSSKQLLVNGKTPGAISMYVWDRQGALRRYDVTVQRDLSRLSAQLTELFPSESIAARSSG